MAGEKIDLRWLVENRSQVQKRMVVLFDLAPLLGQQGGDKLKPLYNMQVGVIFSLWRAVFLVRSDNDFDGEHDHAVALLSKVIETNAIGFADDKNSSNWTAGYYINNAALRLHAIATLKQTKKWLQPATAR